MRVLRGRLLALYCRAIKAKEWIRHSGAPEPKVNDEVEQLSLMRDLMDNLAESAPLVLDLTGAHNELLAERLELQGQIHDLELEKF